MNRYVTARRVSASLTVLLVLCSGCGGSSSNYDANATLRCLRRLTAFRPGGLDATRIGSKSHGVTFTTVGPKRFNYYLSGYDVYGVSGYEIAVRWNPDGRGYSGTFFDTVLTVFDTVKEERLLSRRLANSSVLKSDLKNTTVRRNVFISWGFAQVPKAPRSWVLGCLRD
ncbi:MAG TPA: hypothetical protein VLJ76_00505 [Gaiellaceae bacterium]|nr:hypothetical protein [Gaiellaceae bacterium]